MSNKGICNLCQKEFSTASLIKHIKSCNGYRGENLDRMLLQIKATDDPRYFLILAIRKDQTLRQLDIFLRKTWLECCGHLSCFYIDYTRFESDLDGADEVMSDDDIESMFHLIDTIIPIDEHIQYEYDYGSTTDLTIYRYDDAQLSLDNTPIQILAQNIAPDDDPFNSPGTGVCGYDGPLDPVYLDESYEVIDKRSRQIQEEWNKVDDTLEDILSTPIIIEKQKSTVVKEVAPPTQATNYFNKTALQSREIKLIEENISLIQCIDLLTKEDLVYLRQTMNIKSGSKFTKSDLAKQVVVSIPAWYKKNLKFLDLRQMIVLKKIAAKGYILESDLDKECSVDTNTIDFIKDYMVFTGLGKQTKARVCVMPIEIRALVNEFNIEQYQTELKTHQLWISIMHGACRVYGVLKDADAIALINQLLKTEVNPIDFLNVINTSISFYYQISYRYDGLFYWSSDKDENLVIKEHELRKSIDFKSYSKQEFIDFGKESYRFENVYTQSFKKFLKEAYAIKDQSIQEMISTITNAFLQGDEFSDVLRELNRFIEIPNESVRHKIIHHLEQIYNTTPQWFLKGHTPTDLAPNPVKSLPNLPIHPNNFTHITSSLPASSASPVFLPSTASTVSHVSPASEEKVIDIATRKKISRNDPCPCGSGKKFKHCCGRN